MLKTQQKSNANKFNRESKFVIYTHACMHLNEKEK